MQLRFPRRLLSSVCLATTLPAAGLFLAGCATSAEVRDIVQQSNTEAAAALGDRLVYETGSPASLAPASGNGTGEEPDAIARLSAFVEQHPDNKVTQNALLLRLALLHLNRGSFELARATFERIDGTQLRSARDQGLLAAHEHLLWWRSVAQINEPGVFASTHRAETDRTLRELLTRATASGTPDELRDYLLEMRASIGLKLAADLVDKAAACALIEDSINVFTTHLSPAETTQLQRGRLDPKAQPFDTSTRRVLRTQYLLEALALIWRTEAENVQPTLANPGCQAHYQRLREN